MATARASKRNVTRHLRELASEAETILDDGTVLTKAEVLARLLWKHALGFTEVHYDKNKVPEEIYHPPVQWAIDLVYSRLEGRIPQQIVDESSAITAADRVSELAAERINNAAEAAVAVPKPSPTMDGPGDGAQGSERADGEPPVEG